MTADQAARKPGRTDPRPAARRCNCRHTVGRHAINHRGMRARCTAGPCGCPLFVARNPKES